jgi:uncharacterized protein
MTSRLRIGWPDEGLFERRAGRPYRILAVADEVDRSLDSAATREQLGHVDLVVGCGDLPVDYLQFVTDAMDAPLVYVRGNHDVGGDWETGEAIGLHLPEPLRDGSPWTDGEVTVVGFNGIPRYGGRGLQVGSPTRWAHVLHAWMRLRWRPTAAPLLLISHVAPRGINDGPDRFHRGSRALRWLAGQLQPPLWLHGHTTVVTRRLEDRAVSHERTLFYNAVGAVLIELMPPGYEASPPAEQSAA